MRTRPRARSAAATRGQKERRQHHGQHPRNNQTKSQWQARCVRNQAQTTARQAYRKRRSATRVT
eukprot:55026-Prymnesium_polylepis.1